MQGTSSSDFYLHKDSDGFSTTLTSKFENIQINNVGSAAYVGGTFSAKPCGCMIQSQSADTAFLIRMGSAIGGANGTVSFTINPKSQPYYLPIRPNSTTPFEVAAVSAAGTFNCCAMGFIV